ncbi:MAG: type II toxin-antitoxin system RelE/ParE family toxin [Bacteroidales bacterium]|nr:type II toxin-antitoxin system RelE/ParE family toxin [Bacteroidales bacterium]
MHKLIIKPFAELDVIDISKWYNDKRDGLGDEFLLALDAKINEIQRNPDHHQAIYKKIRRALTDRFPYGVFYIIEKNTIYVLAIIHSSRNPNIWKKKK